MSPRAPKAVKLSDPSTTPIIGKTGRQERGKPIFARSAGSTEDKTQWEIEVTPLVDTTIEGRDVNAAARTEDQGPAPTRPRAVFEIRAAWYGTTPAIPGFTIVDGERRVQLTHTGDVELAQAIARAAVDVLAPGDRDHFDLIEIARDVERRRRA